MKTIKFTWDRNPEANVVAYRISINGTDSQIDANSSLEFETQFAQGEFVTAHLFAVGSLSTGLTESDPAILSFVVPTDNTKPSTPTGFGWQVVQ